MRVFVAINLPDEIRGELEKLQAHLPIGRPVASDNLHLTLSFLGEQSDASCEEAHQALSGIRARPFDLRLVGLGTFGKTSPQVVFADVERCENLIALERKITRRLRDACVPFQKRRFRPHVTIARFPTRISSHGLAQVQAFLAREALFRGSRFQVSEFHFYRSSLTPERAFHEILASYDFTGGRIDTASQC